MPAGRCLVWDVARGTRRLLGRHARGVQGIAFTPDGRGLVSGGAEGWLTYWDVNAGGVIRNIGPGAGVNAVAMRPDGRQVVVGRETPNARLERVELATGQVSLFATRPDQGSVEALALSPDGTRVLTSILHQGWTDVNRPPLLDCDIETWNVETLARERELARSPGLVRAVAFGPEGTRAFWGGGERQAVVEHDLASADPTVAVGRYEGDGESIREVGFGAEGLVLAFRRGADEAGAWEGFDLRGRRFVPVDAGGLVRGLASWQGYTVRGTDSPTALEVVPPMGAAWRLELDPARERRWWGWTFLPPGPDHPKPCIAVGCEGGVAIHELESHARTRFLAGHAGAVYGLAPSADGKWLATGSEDQTARLWTLAGCDRVAPFGARFEREAQGWRVKEVAARGFAEGVGVRVGDLVLPEILYSNKGETPADLEARLDGAPPNLSSISLTLRRGEAVVRPPFTTKRDQPALSVFPSLRHEWIAWMPEGYYETSVAGDARHLAWHVNQAFPGQPTALVAADRYEGRFRKPEVLDRLLATADPVQALALAVPAAAVVEPAALAVSPAPAIRLLQPEGEQGKPLAVGTAALPLDLAVVAAAGERVAEVVVRAEGGDVAAAAGPDGGYVAKVELIPGRNVLSVTARDGRGVGRTERFEVMFEPKEVLVESERTRASRLVAQGGGGGELRGGGVAGDPECGGGCGGGGGVCAGAGASAAVWGGVD